MSPASDKPSEIAEASGCYLGLDQIQRQLVVSLRRTRKEVLQDLPPGPDQVFYVPRAEKNAEAYRE
jgi:hypothetical protein